MKWLPKNGRVTLRIICAAALCYQSTIGYTQNENAKRDISDFLNSTYGIGYTPSFLQKARWNCPEGRMTKPSGTTKRNWVCERPDASYRRNILWSDGESRSSQIEKENFTAMAGGKDAERGDESCVEAPMSYAEGTVQVKIRDCKLPLPNGEFYVSFAHFKYRDAYLNFVVRNASSTGSTPKVAADLREWLAELKFE